MVLRSRGVSRREGRLRGVVWHFTTNHNQSDEDHEKLRYKTREGENKGRVNMEGMTRWKEEEHRGKGADLFMSASRGTRIDSQVSASGEPRALRNPSGVAILHPDTYAFSRSSTPIHHGGAGSKM